MSTPSDRRLSAEEYLARVDKLLGEAERTFDIGKQNALLARVHEIVVEDASWIFVAPDLNPRALAPNVKGFVQRQSWFVDVTSVSAAREAPDAVAMWA